MDLKNDESAVSGNHLRSFGDSGSGGHRDAGKHAAARAYSKSGGRQKWALLAAWRGKRVEMWELIESGRQPGPKLRVEGNSLQFEAAAGWPYLIKLAAEE